MSIPGHFMDYLRNVSEQRMHGEIDLSSSLRQWIDADGGFACEVNGDFLDIGTPVGFCDTVKEF